MQKQSVRWIGILVAITLVSSVLAYQTGISSAQVSPSTVATFHQWAQVNDCNYLIFTDGTNYYAKNGDTGAIPYSGTNFVTVINSAIAALPSDGGTVTLKESTYEMTSGQISIKGKTTLQGQSKSGVIIKAPSPASSDKYWMVNSNPTTDSEGHYHVELVPGEYTITAFDGSIGVSRAFSIEPGLTTTVNVPIFLR